MNNNGKLKIILVVCFLIVIPLVRTISWNPEPPSIFNLIEDSSFSYDINATGESVKYIAQEPYEEWPFEIDSATGFYNGAENIKLLP